MIAALILATVLPAKGVEVAHTVPPMFVEGEPYEVTIEVKVPADEPGVLPTWLFTPAAFNLNGRPLERREGESFVRLAPGTELSIGFDLQPTIESFEGFGKREFRLGFAYDKDVEPHEITFLQAAEKGIDFQELPVQQLPNYAVVLYTTQGVISIQLWSDKAPKHVRNFLDLAYTGFYDGTDFHTVIPQFMIQGGRAKTGDAAPRTLKAEINNGRHVPGVVSMAYVPGDPNSATSEFFIVHSVRPDLDGKYTGFGQVLTGMEVVDKIANAGNKSYDVKDPRAAKPPVEQVIKKAIVVKSPRFLEEELEGK